MAGKAKVVKEDIIKVAFDIVRLQGIDKLNARNIAKKLNTSVQPIFYQFNNMDDVKKEVLVYSLDYYRDFLLNIKEAEPKYKQIGLNYIKFAKEEANLFKFIFMGNYHIKVDNFADFDKSYTLVEQILQAKNNLSSNDVKICHLKMWIFTHGIASLVATDTCYFSDEEISTLLSDEFKALISEVQNK